VYAAVVTSELLIFIPAHFFAAARSVGPALLRFAHPAANALEVASYVVAAAWLYAAWRGVPANHRGTVSPKRAVLSFFIPFYNLYWGVAMNAVLCDTLNRIVRRAGSDIRAPRALGVAANVAWLGQCVAWAAVSTAGIGGTHFARLVFDLLAPSLVAALWVAYMVRCDDAGEVVARLGDRAGRLCAPRLASFQRTQGPDLVQAVPLWGIALLLVAGWHGWQAIHLAHPHSVRAAATSTESRRFPLKP
jgi:hypothetical protein